MGIHKARQLPQQWYFLNPKHPHRSRWGSSTAALYSMMGTYLAGEGTARGKSGMARRTINPYLVPSAHPLERRCCRFLLVRGTLALSLTMPAWNAGDSIQKGNWGMGASPAPRLQRTSYWVMVPVRRSLVCRVPTSQTHSKHPAS